ncbi:enoyl-CoA hydratase/isomerase family protein [Verticillium dahliae VdLs.17]|uniref:Enoyl-CoA hydratase/isomerase family protein n=1 Tax=Verticillium dahliae (strain VdLs.17 / ATCC MYA-4575 / FGSC 10137) TaxID=498257 RepID=G2XBS4_VERDV|nr:enoyl-CoA hydratase/isomerase family protein [Verticillium dahliae VdLs.17]EGY16546.1 enoyl-CoA hydratase/isomerase family protein [Verticillium dahliae VdLs.17]KAH6699164.1 enoyl-CoA hydratase/isomerase family protein [Verticillium dahliae]
MTEGVAISSPRPAMTPAVVLASTPADGVRVLALNRPSKRNALSQELIDVFLGHLRAASADDSVRVIIVTGSSSFFCAGADIKEISALGAEEARQRRYLEDLCTGMRGVRKPLIAAVEGMALGGGFELALMVRDPRTIAISSSLHTAVASGSRKSQSACCPVQGAMKMILLGAPIPASEALDAGLVAALFDDGQVLDNVLAVAQRLASSSRIALSLAKESICRADDLGRDDDFERSLYYYSFGTRDKTEGVAAFLGKRSPEWPN